MEQRDVVIIGGGHNGLAAAAYLARAGLSVEVFERLDVLGGAAVSAEAFSGVDARLSRYSYLVSLLPQHIIDELGLRITLAPRRYSSYTPVPGGATGLLVDNHDAGATEASFTALGAAEDFAAWQEFYAKTETLAKALFDSLTQPLLRRSEVKRLIGNDELWNDFICSPIGQTIERTFSSDVVRGVVYTDGLIGTFASNDDHSLAANRCFLYHVIGNKTGEWQVPIGGMGSVSGELARAAREAGAALNTDTEVLSLGPDRVVTVRSAAGERRVRGERALANVSPRELARLLEAGGGPASAVPQPAAEGAQVKVNLLLKRLPKLRDPSVDPAAAFGGTFHINELFSQFDTAFQQANDGAVPAVIPAEIYCHSLTDPSILGPELIEAGAQTLTVFALHTPHRLVEALSEAEHDAMRTELQAKVLASLNSVLAEPIEDVLWRDENGTPCIETKTTRDIEAALRLPGGNIFQGDLSWPWAEDDAELATPAERWGVATGVDGVFFCGSGAKRGGAVSALGGHNAAMAVLEERA